MKPLINIITIDVQLILSEIKKKDDMETKYKINKRLDNVVCIFKQLVIRFLTRFV